MNTLTLGELIRIVRESAGESEGRVLDDTAGSVAFLDLGYDSLALLEIAGRVSREFGIELPDDIVTSVETPEDFLAVVNDRLDRAA